MHEIGIANSVLDAIRSELRLHPDATPIKVGLRVGELAGVDPDALQFSFQALIADTDLEHLTLEIESKPREHHCAACGITFRVTDYDFACPDCGNSRTGCVSGDELELAYLEMEEP